MVTSEGNSPYSDSIKLICYTAGGKRLWSENIISNYKIRPTALKPTNGGFFLGGSAISQGRAHSILLKLNEVGSILWSTIIDTVDLAFADWVLPQIVECTNGDLLFTSIKDTFSIATYPAAPTIYKLTNEGRKIWQHTSYDIDEQFVFGLLELTSGEIISVGYSGIGQRFSPGIFGSGAWLQGLSADGHLVYERRLLDTLQAKNKLMWLGDIIETENGSLIASGSISVGAKDTVTEEILLASILSNGCFDPECEIADLTGLTQTFAPVGALWHYQPFNGFCDTPNVIVLQAIKDTLVSNKQSRMVVADNNGDSLPDAQLYFWEDDHRVYFYDSTDFRLLYDFNLDVGDTLEFSIPKNRTLYSFYCDLLQDINVQPHYKSVVDEVEWISIDNVLYKKLSTEPLEDSTSIDLGILIEKIGSLYGLAGFLTDPCNAEGCMGEFRCYQDTSFFYQLSQVDCNYTSPTSTENTRTYNFKLVPNPADNVVEIVTEAPWRYTVDVIDVFGKMVLTSRKSLLDTSTISPGWYFVQLRKSGFLVCNLPFVKI
jgi:hypothetical protein